MPITVCPIAQNGGRCRDLRCRLRHDVVQCGPCGCYVLHGGIARHRRGEEHRQNCDFTESQARGSSPACIVPPLPYPRVRKSPLPIPAPKKSTKVPNSRKSKRFGREWRMVLAEGNDLTPKSIAGRGRTLTTVGKPLTSDRMIVSGENGLTLESTAIQHRVFTTATASIFINKLVSHESLTLVSVNLTGAGSNSFATAAAGKLPMPCKWNKPRRIYVAFLPNAAGERNVRLVLRFLDRGRSQKFRVTRKLRGLATSPTEKQRPQPSKPPPCGKESGRAAKRRQKKARQRNVQKL